MGIPGFRGTFGSYSYTNWLKPLISSCKKSKQQWKGRSRRVSVHCWVSYALTAEELDLVKECLNDRFSHYYCMLIQRVILLFQSIFQSRQLPWSHQCIQSCHQCWQQDASIVFKQSCCSYGTWQSAQDCWGLFYSKYTHCSLSLFHCSWHHFLCSVLHGACNHLDVGSIVPSHNSVNP